MDVKKRRECWLLAGVTLLIVCVILVCAHFLYRIEPDQTNLKESIASFYNRNRPEWSHAKEIQVYGWIEFADNAYCLIEIDGELGYAILKKSIAGRYKIEQLGYGNHDYRGGIVEQDGRNYLLYGGRNPRTRIAEIQVEVDDVIYSLAVPKGDYFFVCTEIKYTRKEEYRWEPEALVFDAEGKDITEEIKFYAVGF